MFLDPKIQYIPDRARKITYQKVNIGLRWSTPFLKSTFQRYIATYNDNDDESSKLENNHSTSDEFDSDCFFNLKIIPHWFKEMF